MSYSKPAPVELDFFRMERENFSPPPPKPTRRLKSFKDIQREVSKLNPEVLRSVFASAAVDRSYSVFGKKTDISAPDFGPKQMTIFYNGTVSVFDVPHHHAENILQLAHQGFSKMCIDPKTSHDPLGLLQRLTGDLPVARRRSLKYFLDKRRERITMASSPYGCSFPNKKSPGRSSLSLSLSLQDYQQVQNPMPM